jgi:hypothetical protein
MPTSGVELKPKEARRVPSPVSVEVLVSVTVRLFPTSVKVAVALCRGSWPPDT